MRILVEGAGVGAGGISRYVQQLLGSWGGLDEVTYVTSDRQLGASLPDWVDTVVVTADGRAGTIAKVMGRTAELARSRRPDVVISASPSLTPALPRSVRRIVVLHDLFFRLVPAAISRPQRLYRGLVYRASLSRADLVVCVSNRTAHDLEGWMPGVAGRTRVIGNAAADTFRAEPRWSGPSHPTRLVVTAHNEFKGADRVIRAATMSPGVEFQLLAGSPTRVRALTESVASTGLTARMRVLGHLPDEELRALMVGSSGLIMASDIEGFGLPALEAMAMDVPVVVSPDPALREATNGKAVTMANWSDGALVAAIRELAATPIDHWRAAGRWARTRTWSDVASEMRRAAEELVIAQ